MKSIKAFHKLLSVLTVLLFQTIALNGQEGEKVNYSLQEAIDYAMKENVNIRNAGLEITQGEKMVSEQAAIGLPQLNGLVNYTNYPSLPVSLIPAEFFNGNPGEFVEVQFGTTNNLTASLAATQMIFDPRFFFGLRASKVYVELLANVHNQSKIAIKDIIIKAYYAVLIAEETQRILELNKEIIGDLYFKTSQLYENGFVEEIEADRIRLNLSNIEVLADNNLNRIILAKNLLKYQMGMDISRPIELTDSLDFANARDEDLMVATISPSERTDYKALEIQEILRETNVKLIRSGYYPNADLFANFDLSAQRNSFNFFEGGNPWYKTFMWGVRLNIPIWDSFKRSAAVQQEKITLQTIKNQQQDLRNSIYREIIEARLNYQNSLDQLDAQVDNLELAQKIFDITTIKYDEGVGSSIEVDNSQNTLFDTQTNYIDALYLVLIAKSNLLKALEQ